MPSDAPYRPRGLSRRQITLGIAGVATGLAGCDQGGRSGSLPGMFGTGGPALPVKPDGEPNPNTLGKGEVKVALILPTSAGGQSSQVAQQLRNAAELALREATAGPGLTILVKDDLGTTEGGEAAASQAIQEGAQLIMGPLNAVSARGVAVPARQAAVPVVTFTTDASVASRGVYLIGFLPVVDVERIVAFTASQGKRSFAAMVPDDAYGAVTEAAFRQAAAQVDARVQVIERYKDTSEITAKAQSIAKLGQQIDAVFIPDAASNAAQAAQALQAAGLDRRVRLIGTSRWNEPSVFSNPALAGGWFPAADQSLIEAFRQAYRQAFNTDAGPLAVLGYEAVYLAGGLVRNAGAPPFREELMLSRVGFLGRTGLFRFKPDGTSERGLAVYEIGPGGLKIAAPAPRQFPPDRA
jgi:ABC-type branched-subunit amino acid transport system substrate-binding protein